ncbi:large ribosomal subunit protein uL15-like [Malania oleifera]|uniref:large ribosomal subunit protein uL15-like n=1 Tax=Malania oleifera TaxID=397392 RepID=UPI0025AE1EC3|nr:large ribosomal subunit protein uL15-like [Malania oleifera]
MRTSASSPMLTDLWSHLRASLVTASNLEKREGIMESRSFRSIDRTRRYPGASQSRDSESVQMTTRFKKNRKKRGHMSAGHDRIGKHRKHLGGRGNVRGMHHHRILFDKYHPGYFGKVGMRYFHKLRNKFYYPISTSTSSGPWCPRMSRTRPPRTRNRMWEEIDRLICEGSISCDDKGIVQVLRTVLGAESVESAGEDLREDEEERVGVRLGGE